MKYLVPLLFVASPTLAHDATHAHSHGDQSWIVMAAIMAAFGISFLLWERLQ